MALNRTFNDNFAVRMAATPGTWAAAAIAGSWINMQGYRRCTFICGNGELDGDLAVQARSATDSNGTSAANITGLTEDFDNGTDEGRVGIIEVRDSDLPVGSSYVGLLVTPAATDSFFAVAILSEPYELPVDNGTADGVAFVVGE